MNRFWISCLLGILLSSANAQHALVKQWDKRYGGLSNDYFEFFQQTTDSGYALGGGAYSRLNGDKTQDNWDTTSMTTDYWVVKTDLNGNKQWDKRLGGLSEDNFNNLQQTKDEGYVLAGDSYSDIGGDKTQVGQGGADYWIVKLDVNGNKSWDKRFGGNQDDLLYGMQQTNDGGYILGGTSYSSASGDKSQNNWGGTDYWIVKTDSNGNKLWDNRFGGTDDEVFNALIQSNDGGYVLGGSSVSDSGGDKTQATWGNHDYWVVKIDASGNKLWDADFGGNSDDYLQALIQTSDKGFLLGGSSTSEISGNKTENEQGGYDYWVVKIDSNGNKQWDKDYGGSGIDQLVSLGLTNDGGYLLTGDSQSPASGDKTESNTSSQQTWIIKIDSLGNKQWDKTIIINGSAASPNAAQTKDGCYAVGSYTPAEIGGYKTQMNWDSSVDYWIVKFCDTIISGVSEITNTVNLTIYPNPFATDIAIALQKQNLQQADFTITNTLGQTIYTQHETNLSLAYTKMLDLSYLPNGVYLLQVVLDGERITKQIVKQ